jgi:hypothetical protein
MVFFPQKMGNEALSSSFFDKVAPFRLVDQNVSGYNALGMVLQIHPWNQQRQQCFNERWN